MPDPNDSRAAPQAPTPRPRPREQGEGWQVSLRRPRARRAFTLLEALIASVIVAMVAATASMSVAVGAAVEQQNRMSVLAMQAAELQMGTLLEASYDGMQAFAGSEASGSMLGPPRPGSANRAALPSSFDGLSRTTTVSAENRSFSQYNNHTVEGKRIEVAVSGPDGTVLARLVRFRGKDPET